MNDLPFDLMLVAQTLSPVAAECERRLKVPNGPPVVIYVDGSFPIRAVLAVYSLVINGYSPQGVSVYGEHRWTSEIRELLTKTLPFAAFPSTAVLLGALKEAGGADLVSAIGRHDSGLRASMALLCPWEEMCVLEDDVFVLDGLDEGVNRLRTHDFVYAPSADKSREYRLTWKTARRIPRPLVTGDFGGGVYWLRPTAHPGLISQVILRSKSIYEASLDEHWFHSLLAVSFGKQDVWKLQSAVPYDVLMETKEPEHNEAGVTAAALPHVDGLGLDRHVWAHFNHPLKPQTDAAAFSMASLLLDKLGFPSIESRVEQRDLAVLDQADEALVVISIDPQPNGLTPAGAADEINRTEDRVELAPNANSRRVKTSSEVRVPSLPRMTPAELALFDSETASLGCIVEFGMGGSTVRLLQQTLANVITVESDTRWCDAVLSTELAALHVSSGRLIILPIDIGEVGNLGFPRDRSVSDTWPSYWKAPWSVAGAQTADLVFIDGRFRVASALNALVEGPLGAKLMIHDFWSRPHYQLLLRYLDPIAQAETLGVFAPKKEIDFEQVAIDLAKHAKDPR